MHKVDILSTDIIPVYGYTRSVLMDLTREDYDFVPNFLYELIVNNHLDEIPNDFKNWLIYKDYILSIPFGLKNNFSNILEKWEFPSHILTLTIDFRFIEENSITVIIELIEHLNIKSIVLILCYNEIKNKLIAETLIKLNETKLDVIEILCNYQDNIDWTQTAKDVSKIKNIVEYKSLENNFLLCGLDNQTNFCRFTHSFKERNLFKQDITYFTVNTELYTETLAFNNYYNKRLHINLNGNLFNSLESSEISIFKSNVKNILSFKSMKLLTDFLCSENEFNHFSNATKEKCDVCKDCEFRYMCVDNRIPFSRDYENYFFKIECNYNPYICKWSHEEGYKTLEECGVITNEHEFSIDNEKIALINKDLCEDE